MDNENKESFKMNTTNMFSNKNFIITVLVILLILSFLGINLLNIVGNFMEVLVKIFGPLVNQILSIFGYTAGTIIDKGADLGTDVATTGVEIAGGSVQSIGKLLIDASKKGVAPDARKSLNTSFDLSEDNSDKSKQSLDLDKPKRSLDLEPSPDTTKNPIQNPISSKKGWCLVGEYQGKRGCIEIGEYDKCLSGQVFPEEKLCLNPTFTQYTLTH